MKLLIADDHEIVREGLKRILKDSDEIYEIGEASDTYELMEKLNEKKWDVVVLDINMPGKNGLEALKDIKQLYQEIPVLVLSMYPEEQFAVRVIKAGASGYINKTEASEELLNAILKVYKGGRYISAGVSEQLVEELKGGSVTPRYKILSDREFQVLRMIADGKTVGEIADELALSVKTISTYRANILSKLKLKNNAEIMKYALQNDLSR